MPYESIWSILGLSSPTKDITEIKKAYAAKAKMTNPEDDPEGFEKLHNAYKSALTYARSAGRTAMPVIKSTPVVTPKPEPAKKEPEEPKESFDFSSVDVNKPHKKEPIKAVTKKEDDFDFSSVKTNPEPKIEVRKPVSFDYSSVIIPTPGITDPIRFFKEENKVCSDADVKKLPIMAKRSIAEKLTSLYINTAYSNNNTDLWKDYWEEPIIRYYRQDPHFRKWVTELVKNKTHNEVVKKQADSYKKSLPVYRWNSKPKYAGSKLASWQEKIVVVVCMMITAVMFGFYYHKDNYEIDHLWESLALGAAGVIVLFAYDAVDKAAENARKKKKSQTQKK